METRARRRVPFFVKKYFVNWGKNIKFPLALLGGICYIIYNYTFMGRALSAHIRVYVYVRICRNSEVSQNENIKNEES